MKMTKKQLFEKGLSLAKEIEIPEIPEVSEIVTEEMVVKATEEIQLLQKEKDVLISGFEHEIELLNNAKGGKQTKLQEENEKIKATISQHLLASGDHLTVTEINGLDGLGEYSNQKLSALIRQLVADEIVEKEIVKRITYFFIADKLAETEEEIIEDEIFASEDEVEDEFLEDDEFADSEEVKDEQ